MQRPWRSLRSLSALVIPVSVNGDQYFSFLFLFPLTIITLCPFICLTAPRILSPIRRTLWAVQDTIRYTSCLAAPQLTIRRPSDRRRLWMPFISWKLTLARLIENDWAPLFQFVHIIIPMGREWCLRQAFKSNFGLVWPWPLTSWSSKFTVSSPCLVDHLCQKFRNSDGGSKYFPARW